MPKGLKNLLVLFMTFAISLVSIISVFAFDVDSSMLQPMTTYITSTAAKMDVGALSTDVSGYILGTSSVTKVKIKLQLQKESDGVYTTVATWEETYNSKSATLNESKLTSPLSNYRLKATFTAYSGSNSESKTVYKYE